MSTDTTIKYPADGSLVNITMEADERYSLNWGLFEHIELGKEGAVGALSGLGKSMMHITVHGVLVSTDDESADKMLWSRLLLLGANYTERDFVARLSLVLQTGTLVLTGWMTGFVADREAPEGAVRIPCTIEFFIKGVDHSGIT